MLEVIAWEKGGGMVLRFVDRREWLRVGLGCLGLGPCTARAHGPRSVLPGFGKARSVLVVYTGGGMSQIDTWDPKPDAPAEVRGAFKPIATRVSGTHLGEHLPRVARLAD